jgi:hypothetical protein
MGRQRLEDDVGQRDRPIRSLGLRRSDERLSTLHRDELALDPDLTAQEVDALEREPEALSLTQPGSGREHDDRAIPLRSGVHNGAHDLRREGHDGRPVLLRTIASYVATAPHERGVTDEHRIALCEYLSRRRDALAHGA